MTLPKPPREDGFCINCGLSDNECRCKRWCEIHDVEMDFKGDGCSCCFADQAYAERHSDEEEEE